MTKGLIGVQQIQVVQSAGAERGSGQRTGSDRPVQRWTPRVVAGAEAVTADTAELVREGEYWSIRFADVDLRVRDCKGIQFLAELLAHPGREIEALTLVAGGSLTPVTMAEAAEAGLGCGGESDLGPVLDGPAKRAYRERLEELREELDHADVSGDVQRSERARREWEAIADELRAATGLGGRDRRAGSPAERARLNVTRAIKTAIARIAAHDESLGDHLSACVRTGRACVYRPDRSAPITWTVRSRSGRPPRRPLTPRFGPAPDIRVRAVYQANSAWPVAAGTRMSLASTR